MNWPIRPFRSAIFDVGDIGPTSVGESVYKSVSHELAILLTVHVFACCNFAIRVSATVAMNIATRSPAPDLAGRKTKSVFQFVP